LSAVLFFWTQGKTIHVQLLITGGLNCSKTCSNTGLKVFFVSGQWKV